MNDAAPTPRVWAHKGEAIVCLNGHPVCEVARTLYFGEPLSGKHFTNWVQPEPDHSESVANIKCKQCRSVWLRGNKRDGYQFHFADGWR